MKGVQRSIRGFDGVDIGLLTAGAGPALLVVHGVPSDDGATSQRRYPGYVTLGVLFAILIPIGEVWTAIQVAHHIGWLATIALLIVISACGPSLVRRQGMGVWRRAQRRMEDGEVPGREAIDGVLLLVAGGLLTFPGFITGVLGLLLLLPPVRSVVRVASRAWLARKVRRSGVTVRVSATGLRPSVGDGDRFDRGGQVTTADSYPLEHPRRALDALRERDHPPSPG